MNTGALLPDEGSGYFTDNGSCTSGRPLKCSWRAGCGGTRKSGSEGSGEETTGREGRHRRLAADPAPRAESPFRFHPSGERLLDAR